MQQTVSSATEDGKEAIVAGPSRDELMPILFELIGAMVYPAEATSRRTVEFVGNGAATTELHGRKVFVGADLIKVVLTRVELAHAYGGSFNFAGVVSADPEDESSQVGTLVEGFFTTKESRGWLKRGAIR